MTELRPKKYGSRRNDSMPSSALTSSHVRLQKLMRTDIEVRSYSDHRTLEKLNPWILNNAWREKVAQWFYDVVDHFDVPRDTVYLSMNILDRYLAVISEGETMNKLDYEAAALTSAFLAVRVSSESDLRIHELLELSRSSLQVRDILKTGTRILELLTWELRIPTPTDFLKALLGLLKSSIDARTAVSLFELSSYIVEISVYDEYFCGTPAPKVAFAALLIAIRTTERRKSDQKAFSRFLLKVNKLTGMAHGSSDIKSIYNRLQSIYSQSQDNSSNSIPHVILEEDDSQTVHTIESSPRDIMPLLKNTPTSNEVVNLRPISPCPDRPCKRAKLV